MKHPISCFRKAHFLLKRNWFKNQRNKYKHKAKHTGVCIGHSFKMSCHSNTSPVFNGASLGSNHIQTLLGCMLLYALKRYSPDTTKIKSSHKPAAEAQKEEAFRKLFHLLRLTYEVISDLLLTCVCVLIVKIRVIIRNDWWPRVVIFIFSKFHLEACFRKPEQTVVIVFFPVPLQSERHQEDILNHTSLSKCEPYYFYIFWECHCSEKFQMKGWYKTLFPNVSNGEFSCSDYFSFVEGHIKLYVHIKQSYVSLG